jgi:chromobox protein 1
VDEYYDRIGGRPQAPEKSGRKRKSMGEAKSTPEASSTKRSRKSRGTNGTETDENGEIPNWVPNSENWDRDVLKVETIVRDPDSEGLMAYLHWSNGRKSRVSIDQCYEKIPLKVK